MIILVLVEIDKYLFFTSKEIQYKFHRYFWQYPSETELVQNICKVSLIKAVT